MIYDEDCGTINGLVVADLKEGEEIIEPLADRVLGRTILDDLIVDGKVIIKSGQLISEVEADIIDDNNIDNIRIRSVLTCESMRGVCAKCYGWNLSTHNLVNRGTSVGIQAAQSIGEPGTQLTLRTFHIGGTATRIIEQSEMTTKFAGSIKFSDSLEIATTKDEDGSKVNRCMVRNAKITVVDSKGKELNDYNVPYGSDVTVTDGEKVKGGHVLFQWDPYTDLILARQTGKIQLKDFIEGETYKIESC